MDYGKITTTNKIQKQGNPVSVSIANPTEAQKATMAGLRGELEMVYTTAPTYDPETQRIEDFWHEVNDQAVQYWEIYDLPEPEPTLEDRVDSLEENISDIINGVTE